ncbi:Glycosyl transferases group 1 [Propionibacterium cyclohexanicum]|uniref:Glycosyl transferases group 1 n=1 Tax=Propionibacterium cyclohexanicum TaxID=64702 RepID=A0A1H9SH19_9ACTN|nr:glycosyltransferase [Propionibacterium cyclohexanicum]SER84264.1 Glycosyl transferases group 1 [Propionibacterium cyclohexanicum]
MRILVWHVHGGWMNSFVRGRHEYLLPTLPEGGPWGLGRGGRDWPASARECAPGQLREEDLDAVVLQRPEEIAQCQRLTGRTPGRDLPAIYLEHNTPKGQVPSSVHPLADQATIPIAHVTHFNELFWDNGRAPTRVIEHGIVDPGEQYTGERACQSVVVNEPVRRGRVTGTDLLAHFAQQAPLEVYGMGTGALNGLAGLGPERAHICGDLPTAELHAQLARTRLYLHPVRWTSLGLSLLEAMHLAMPVVVLATTEAVRAVPAEAGAISTDVAELARAVRILIADPEEARRRGRVARAAALSRYGLARFLDDWDELLSSVVSQHHSHRTRRQPQVHQPSSREDGARSTAPRSTEGSSR